jgi:hypothetical protein
MPDEIDNDDEFNDEGNQPNWRRKLEADAKEGREAKARLAEMEQQLAREKRELAMRRAGIDTEKGVGALFAKAYDGEVDVDQIKSEWQKLNLGTGAPQVGQTNTGVASEQQAAMERIADATAGSISAGGGHDFGAELDSIPEVVDGAYNPNYVQNVLSATAAQAARENRPFEVSQGQIGWQKGAAGPKAATTPL